MSRLTAPIRTSLFIAAVGLAALNPLAARTTAAPELQPDANFPGWPDQFEGRALTPLPMTEKEQAFARDFPGRTGRFTDGRREIVIRYVTAATRRLHPAADCFRGIGYRVTPIAMRKDAAGRSMSCIGATRGSDRLTVCESIRAAGDRSDTQSWADVSAWHWSALLGRSSGPWWSFVIAEGTQ